MEKKIKKYMIKNIEIVKSLINNKKNIFIKLLNDDNIIFAFNKIKKIKCNNKKNFDEYLDVKEIESKKKK